MNNIWKKLGIISRENPIGKMTTTSESDHDKQANVQEDYDKKCFSRTKSLVDEMDQNSLDSGCNSGVKKIDSKITEITFRYIDSEQMTIPAKQFLREFKEELEKVTHGKCPHQNVEHCLRKSGSGDALLVIEDSNTTGLTGGYKAKEYFAIAEEINVKPLSEHERFFGLHYFEGQSNKSRSKHSVGSRGLGKEVCTKSSDLRSYITVTKRYDDNKKLLFGQTIFNEGIVHDGKMSENYFHFGLEQKDKDGRVSHVDAFDKTDEIDKFCKDLGISRDTPGTSQIVLEPIQEVRQQKYFLRAICERWWLPVHKKKLRITLEGWPTSQVVDHTTLPDILKKFNCTREIEAIEYLSKFEKLPQENIIDAKIDAVADKKVSPGDFEANDIQKLRQIWADGTPGQIRIPLQFMEKDSTEKITNYLHINFARADGLKDQNYFVRDLLIITQALKDTGNIKDSFFYVEPMGDLLCMFVKNAENLSHVRLDANDENHNKYFEFGFVEDLAKNQHRRAILNILEKGVSEIYNSILSEQITDDLDEALFADILSLNFEGSKKGSVSPDEDDRDDEEEEEIKKTDPTIDPVIMTKIHMFKIKKNVNDSESRFEIESNPEFTEDPIGEIIKISVSAKDQMDGKERLYQSQVTDFSLPNIKTNSIGVTEIKRKNNNIELKIDNKNFKFEASGYDSEFAIDIRANGSKVMEIEKERK